MRGNMIRLNSEAFGNHMRAKTNRCTPWCLHLADDFAVFEFNFKHDLESAMDMFQGNNEYYQYGIFSDGKTRLAITNPGI